MHSGRSAANERAHRLPGRCPVLERSRSPFITGDEHEAITIDPIARWQSLARVFTHRIDPRDRTWRLYLEATGQEQVSVRRTHRELVPRDRAQHTGTRVRIRRIDHAVSLETDLLPDSLQGRYVIRPTHWLRAQVGEVGVQRKAAQCLFDPIPSSVTPRTASNTGSNPVGVAPPDRLYFFSLVLPQHRMWRPRRDLPRSGAAIAEPSANLKVFARTTNVAIQFLAVAAAA